MSVAPKPKRFNMFLSKAELDAVDDWRYTNCVFTRSEAVLQLVKAGIQSHASLVARIAELEAAVIGLRGFMPPAGDDRVDAVLRAADAALLSKPSPTSTEGEA